MASFKYLIFFTLAALSVYCVAGDSLVREKKHAYYTAPVVAYSAPSAYSYSRFTSYPSPYRAAYPAYSAYSAYPSYAYAHSGKYWPGKYEKAYYPYAYKSYPYAYKGYPYHY